MLYYKLHRIAVPFLRQCRCNKNFGGGCKKFTRNYSKKTSDGVQSLKNETAVCTISECMIDACTKEPTVVIIGAGIAGLSAAQRLMQCGLSKFHILEATDRPGGRIHSCWLNDVIAELGAEYIQGGCCANPIYNIACQEGLLATPVTRCQSSLCLFCTSDGRAIDSSISVTAYNVVKQIEHEAMRLFSMSNKKKHGTLLQFLAIRIQQELQHFPEDMRFDASRVMHGMVNSIRERCGDDLSLVSVDNYGSFITIPGGKVRVPLGYVGVIAPLLRDLPPCSLHYCKPVSRINWGSAETGGHRAVVQCCDGDQFPADYVICTVSLGVLKKYGEKLFCPTLPAVKQEAINALGYGLVDKVFLEYNRPFWAWHEGGIHFAWSPDELSNRCDWTRGLSCIAEVEGSKHVLCGYVSGPEAAQMEIMTDEEVAESVTRLLRQFTGDSFIPYPDTILRSKWATDPYFHGAYSYIGMNSNVGHQCDLSAPVPSACKTVVPTLFFAGEATCAGHYSTAHGARFSGIREAERIIQLTKQLSGPPPSTCPC